MNASDGRGLRWPLSRVLVLVLAGAFIGLMTDIRVEHVDVVHDNAIAWVPIIYSGVMAVACLIAAIAWNKTSRLIMLPLFILAFGVGGLGFYKHNQGDLARVQRDAIHAWTDRDMSHPDGPPQVAPLAFAGLGLLGALASLKRFN